MYPFHCVHTGTKCKLTLRANAKVVKWLDIIYEKVTINVIQEPLFILEVVLGSLRFLDIIGTEKYKIMFFDHSNKYMI